MPSSREEDFKINNAFSLNNLQRLFDLYGHAPAQEPLPRGSWNLQFSNVDELLQNYQKAWKASSKNSGIIFSTYDIEGVLGQR